MGHIGKLHAVSFDMLLQIRISIEHLVRKDLEFILSLDLWFKFLEFMLFLGLCFKFLEFMPSLDLWKESIAVSSQTMSFQIICSVECLRTELTSVHSLGVQLHLSVRRPITAVMINRNVKLQ